MCLIEKKKEKKMSLFFNDRKRKKEEYSDSTKRAKQSFDQIAKENISQKSKQISNFFYPTSIINNQLCQLDPIKQAKYKLCMKEKMWF